MSERIPENQGEVVMIHSVEPCLDTRQRVLALAIAMAGMVEAAADKAIEALLTGDGKLAGTILEKEPLINQIELQLDNAVLAHLGGGRPHPAEDVRFLASMLKINKDLERMGDLAANIGRNVLDVSQANHSRSELQPLAIAVSHVCRKALRALVHQDMVLAQSAQDSAQAVQQYRDYVFQQIRTRMENNPSDASQDLSLLLSSRYLEQIGDHALNLADNLSLWLKPREQEAVAC
jgi:phosphate transport system protein